MKTYDELIKGTIFEVDIEQLRDDAFWPPFPDGLSKILPTIARLRDQHERHVSIHGVHEDMGEDIAEFLHLHELRLLQLRYRELADFLSDHTNGASLQDSLDAAIEYAFRLGQTCPPKVRTLKATQNTKGRIPKWYKVADEIRTELAAKSPIRGTAPSKRARYKLLHKHLSERLAKLNMKPVSEFAVRDYLAYVDRERT
jgi:hypothetical protein